MDKPDYFTDEEWADEQRRAVPAVDLALVGNLRVLTREDDGPREFVLLEGEGEAIPSRIRRP